MIGRSAERKQIDYTISRKKIKRRRPDIWQVAILVLLITLFIASFIVILIQARQIVELNDIIIDLQGGNLPNNSVNQPGTFVIDQFSLVLGTSISIVLFVITIIMIILQMQIIRFRNKQIKKVREENKRLQSTIVISQSEIEELSNQNKALQLDIEKLVGQNKGLQSDIEELNNQNKILQLDIERLKNKPRNSL